MSRYRIHLLSLPNAPLASAFSLCGFTSATMRFAKVLRMLGHHVTLYGSEGSEAVCDEFVPVLTDEERVTILKGVPYQAAPMTASCYAMWDLSNKRMIREIAKRKQPRDFLMTIGGASHLPVLLAHDDLISVEWSIGYVASCAGYRVYESHVWRHCTAGFQGQAQGVTDGGQGRFFDTVIPLFFEADAFTLQKKENFALYVGRLTDTKGIDIACQAAKAAGVPLKLIGHGDRSLITYGDYLGALPDEARNGYMARAACVLCPTKYLEPFGSTAVEAQMAGTPAISTNWGGFVETIEHSVTGYRCNYLGEFVNAIHAVNHLDHRYIAERARRLYSLEAVAPQYQAYFDRLNLLHTDGWNTVEAPMLELAVA